MRQLLPKTYYPFFARFRHPSPIQEAAAPALLSGAHCLLVSPTASGKTEAFAAPLVERTFSALKANRGLLLLVCPTRALVNDAARRLGAPLQACGLTLARRTGDSSQDPQLTPAALWITTPEGFDSLLCRFPRWLANAQAIVVDEIHLLRDSARGTQVMCLLERLDRVCEALSLPKPQRVGATATANRPNQLAADFLGEGARVIDQKSRRTVRLHYDRWVDYPTLADTLKDLPQARKALIFANSRNEAEEAAAALHGVAPYGRNVWVHHASLSKSHRLGVEQAFLRETSGLLCCTTTMEVGVDVGDVDWTVLLHPPESRSSFLQRAGRSGRRSGPAQVLALTRGAADELRYEFFMHPPEALAPDKAPEPPLHLSVVGQQALSLLWQSPRKQVTPAALLSRLPRALAAEFSLEELDQVLQNLEARNWLSQQSGVFMPGRRLEQAARLGNLHSNIGETAQKTVEIRDQTTGQVIGQVAADRQGRVPAVVRLGGRTHQLRQDRQGKSLIASSTDQFSETAGASHGPAAPVSVEAAQEFARWSGLGPRCLIQAPQGNLVGHFLGSCWGEMLRRHLEQNYPGSVLYADPYVVAWKGSMVEQVWSEEALQGCLKKFASTVQRQLGCGRWFSYLPPAKQRQELQRLLYWDWICQQWLGAQWVTPDTQGSERLQKLLYRDRDFTIAGFFPIQVEDL